MSEAVAMGLGGLAVLVLLIALRIPIAYAMILVGGLGTMLLNGPQLVLSQLKTRKRRSMETVASNSSSDHVD